MADSKNRCTFAADFKQIARDDGLHLGKKPAFCSRFTPSLQPLSKDCTFKVDPLAQSVEHNTFNVGVLGSSPKRITEKRGQMTSLFVLFLIFLIRIHHRLRLLRFVFWGCELPAVGNPTAEGDGEGEFLRTWDRIERYSENAQFHMFP